MPISLGYPINPTAKSVRLDILSTDNDTTLVAWWYCGIYKNKIADSQPHVLVGFRELKDNNLSEGITFKRIPLTALGQVTLGSIWKEGVCMSAVAYDTHRFEIDFTSGGWSFTSFEQTFINKIAPPYPHQLYPLQYRTDKNWLIEFRLTTGGRLIVPCLEFFSRCYGRSQELKRILTTYPWNGPSSLESRLYSPIDEPEESGKWKVKLRKRLRNGDTIFLAHAKYDLYTEKVAKSIYAQLEENFKPESKLPIFIQARPWFQGPAEIKVRGIWFDNNKSFLALGIIGCSDPDGILISRERDNTNKRVGADKGDELDEGWASAVKKKLVWPPDIVSLTGDAEPDHGSNSVEILDNNFEVLGIPRLIVDRYGKKVADRTGVRKNGDDPSFYSSGEAYGSGKGVGYASIHAQPVMESKGALMDIWNAAQHIKKKYHDKIQSVDWYTFQDGYKAFGIPRLIALEPIDELDEPDIPKQTRNWIYYDVATKVVRGVMVIRIVTDGIPVYIIEIQRRPRIRKGQNEESIEGEEPYKGFVTIIENDGDFLQWLKRFLYEVRYVRGIMEKLTTRSPFKAAAFAHSRADGDDVINEASILNALKKMDIRLICP